jgi:hypothetical protein
MTQLDAARLNNLSLSGVAITAQIDQDGHLHPVTGSFPKLLTVVRKNHWVAIPW